LAAQESVHDGHESPRPQQDEDSDCGDANVAVGEELCSEDDKPTLQSVDQQQQDKHCRHRENNRSAALPFVKLAEARPYEREKSCK
jgi:hypothetical protein